MKKQKTNAQIVKEASAVLDAMFDVLLPADDEKHRADILRRLARLERLAGLRKE
jgi:hypothetical protein